MHTYIISNGRRYSDHALHFVRTKAPVELVQEAVRCMNLCDEEFSLCGEARLGITWLPNLRGIGNISMHQLFEVYGHLWYGEDCEPQILELLAKFEALDAA
jgi:hypothetical protein